MDNALKQAMKWAFPSVDGPAPQKGQNVANFPGYQKSTPPPQTMNVDAIKNFLGNFASQAGNFIGKQFTGSTGPVMYREPQHETIKIGPDGTRTRQIGNTTITSGPQQPSATPMPSASPIAQIMQAMAGQGTGPMQKGPQATPYPMSDAAAFRFQMGQNSYPDAQRQLQAMFGQYNAPMAEYIPQFVEAGEKYGVDPRVLALIAQIESSGGKAYPRETFNPFGYRGGDDPAVNKLNAGFTSIPHAIDALTNRFARQPLQGYKTFYQDPSINNLQQAYNANPAEQSRYLNLSGAILPYLQ